MDLNAVRRLFRIVLPKYPAFNVYSHVTKKTTALGPLCVATSVSRMPGWDAEVIDENNFRFPGLRDRNGLPDHEALQSLRQADVVGFYGGLTCTIPRLLKVAAAYKNAGCLTIGGGQHIDALPEESLHNGLDVVVNGEGEEAIMDVLNAWEHKRPLRNVSGITLLEEGGLVRTKTRSPLRDFDRFPLPDFGLLRYSRVKVFPVGRIRGCGMDCEFCCVRGRPRCATPERLMAQIAYLVEAYHAREFFIVDDLFAQDRQETLRFCNILRDYQKRMRIRLFLTVQVRLDNARDKTLLQSMYDCGMHGLAIGIESPIDEELLAMGKRLKAEEMVELARTYRRFGFLVHGMFIFGYPMPSGSRFSMGPGERVRRYRGFFRKARLDTIQVVLPVPLPGTRLRERLRQEGRLLPLERVGWEYYDGNFPTSVPDAPLTIETIQKSMVSLMGGFYRGRRLLGVVFHTVWFPFVMFPFICMRARWKKWYRRWRNDVIGSMGYFVVRNWRKAFCREKFLEKVRRFENGAGEETHRERRKREGEMNNGNEAL